MIGPVGPGFAGTITDDFAILANVIGGTGTLINDSYGFSITALSDIGAAFADFQPPNTNPGDFGTVLTGFAVFDVNATPLFGDVDATNGLAAIGQLAAGNYVLVVVGITTGALGGIYAGALGAVTAVPEPQSYLMMALGLVALGGWSMRRQRGR